MSVYRKVSAFLNRHGFSAAGYDVNTLIESLLYDMEKGLSEGAGKIDSMDGAQYMIPTWGLPPESAPKNQKIIVIDAGGTNFRSCLVTFDENGNSTISDMEKTSMPGIERELSKKEFFDAIANNLEHLKNKADRIGFCFSYAMDITPDGDGVVTKFSKEIKASEVEGSVVGECLAEALVQHGWKKPSKVILLNDTTAALLAGASDAKEGRSYSSYVGFILGTGLNAAYIESNPIKKIADVRDSAGNPPPASQIIVCESGSFNKLQASDFDFEYDKTTVTPGLYRIEKMCSGAYLGPVSLVALKHAAEEGLFTAKAADAIKALKKLELKEIDAFLRAPGNSNNPLGAVAAAGTREDADTIYTICDCIIERSARLAASIIASSVIKCGKGTSPSCPVGVVCNGTTYYKTHNLRNRICGYLNDVLTSQRHLYFELLTVEDDITLGTAIAAAER